MDKKMDEVIKDPRFKHIISDSRFRNMPKEERKFKVDKRFKVIIQFNSIKFSDSIMNLIINNSFIENVL
jgi:hypothetical protein